MSEGVGHVEADHRRGYPRFYMAAAIVAKMVEFQADNRSGAIHLNFNDGRLASWKFEEVHKV